MDGIPVRQAPPSGEVRFFGPVPPARETLGKSQRLRTNREIREAYAQDRRHVARSFVLFFRAGEGADRRLGVVASRKVGNAVERARAKRRLRELFRRNRAAFPGPDDVVLVARRPILSAPFGKLVEDLRKIAAAETMSRGFEDRWGRKP
jgi:ribonuclease P protein component